MFERKYRCSGCNQETVVKQQRAGGRRRVACWACRAVLVLLPPLTTTITILSPKKRRAVGAKLSSYRKSAIKRKLPFTLTTDVFSILLKSECHYCGISPTISEMGIDRKDNDRGYVSGNCLPACRHCNYAKGRLSYDVFTEEIEARRFYFNSFSSGARLVSQM